MGWDAYADLPDPRNPLEDGDLAEREKELERCLVEFRKAAERVVAEAGSVDGNLSTGGLDVSTCAYMLEQATNQSAYDEGWSPEKVQLLAKEADWSFAFDTDRKWAYFSALEFLNTCARLGKGIRFSW
jgi:ribonucleotide reductase beta subunit family protein with ferritin-like domain